MERSYEDMVREIVEAEQNFKKASQEISKAIAESQEILTDTDNLRIATQVHAASFETLVADMEAMAENEQKQKQATLDIAAGIDQLNKKIDTGYQEQKASAEIATRRDKLTLFIAILTLIATVLIGIITISLQIWPPQQMTQQEAKDSSQSVVVDDIRDD